MGIYNLRHSASVADGTTLDDYPALLTEGRTGVLTMVPSFTVTGEIKFYRSWKHVIHKNLQILTMDGRMSNSSRHISLWGSLSTMFLIIITNLQHQQTSLTFHNSDTPIYLHFCQGSSFWSKIWTSSFNLVSYIGISEKWTVSYAPTYILYVTEEYVSTSVSYV